MTTHLTRLIQDFKSDGLRLVLWIHISPLNAIKCGFAEILLTWLAVVYNSAMFITCFLYSVLSTIVCHFAFRVVTLLSVFYLRCLINALGKSWRCVIYQLFVTKLSIFPVYFNKMTYVSIYRPMWLCRVHWFCERTCRSDDWEYHNLIKLVWKHISGLITIYSVHL